VSGGEIARDDCDIFGVRSGISSGLASGSVGGKGSLGRVRNSILIRLREFVGCITNGVQLQVGNQRSAAVLCVTSSTTGSGGVSTIVTGHLLVFGARSVKEGTGAGFSSSVIDGAGESDEVFGRLVVRVVRRRVVPVYGQSSQRQQLRSTEQVGPLLFLTGY
jgi:hypothetical protein